MSRRSRERVAREILRAEDLGLTLAEAKDLLAGVQRRMVTQQAKTYAMPSMC
jgi:hypothetical protein